MGFALCYCKYKTSLPPIFTLLAPLLVLSAFLGYGFLSILLTSTALIFSTLISMFSYQKPCLMENKEVKDVTLTSLDDHQSSPYTQEKETQEEEEEEEETLQGEEETQQIDESLAGSSAVVLSESDCLGRSSTSEDSEGDWLDQDKMFRSPDWSDGSISDEESLIEITLPGGHHIGDREEEAKFKMQKKLPDFFKQHGLMELLAEMNEEENLIEIDISMGSIKCPRFEIEA